MSAPVHPRADTLRAWACGDLALEAFTELLIRALRGRLLDGPWIRRHDHDGHWFDPGVAAQENGALNGVLAHASSRW